MNYRERTKLVDGLCGAFLMALLAEAFYGLADYAFTVYHYSISSVTNIVYIISGIMLAVSLVVLMLAYKKDNGTMGAYGAELLALAITATIIPGTYVSLPSPFNKFNVVFPLAFGIYYVGKCMKLLLNKNNSNIVFMAVIESILAIILTYGLYDFATPVFFAGSIVALVTYILSIKKKSKKLLVHGLEVMLVAFSLLVMQSKSALIFLAVLVGIYYMFKTAYVFFNPEKSNKKEKRRK